MILPFFLKELVSFEVKYSDFKILLFDFFLDSPEFLIFSGKFLFEIFKVFGFHRIFPVDFFFVFVPPPQMTKKGIYKRGYGREGVQLEGDPGVPWSWGSYRQ